MEWKIGKTNFACIMHQAATSPAMAPEAPREVTVSLFWRTWAAREVSEAMAPEEK